MSCRRPGLKSAPPMPPLIPTPEKPCVTPTPVLRIKPFTLELLAKEIGVGRISEAEHVILDFSNHALPPNSIRRRQQRFCSSASSSVPEREAERHHPVAVRANMRSILVAMMKSFSCSPLIFLVSKETVAFPQPKLIFG
jgi:hypothetical protein